MTPEVLGRALGEAPNPELARIAVSRVGERPAGRDLLAQPEIIPAAARLLGFSTAAADFFSRHPEELASLAETGAPTRQGLVAEAAGDVCSLGVEAGLRRFRRRASYRLAARDLAGLALDEVVRELTWIAEVCLDLAREAVGGGLAIVGMGKLGGSELNYSSDVDVLFLHDEEVEDPSAGAAAVVELLSAPTADGIALRVDADLRPEGRAGPLSRSLASMLEYYERHAATWERQALLKARPVAGPEELGRRFVEGVEPFVFPAVLPASAIDDVRATKARIEEVVRAAGKERTELKRGRGGIRDIEFAVQLLQLVHGRRDARLRTPSTLLALAALAEGGYVAEGDAVALADSYRFLRRLEHRLQMARDLQAHELPADRAAWGPLARSLGMADGDELLAAYLRHTEVVRSIHLRLFHRPLLEAFAGPSPGPGLDRATTEELLGGLGFADPSAAYRRFRELVDPGTRLGTVLGALFPVLAPALAYAPAPDAALVRFGRTVEALGEVRSAPDLLTDRPDAARRLASLAAVSSAFTDLLVARPALVAGLVEAPSGQSSMLPPDPGEELLRVAGAFAAGELAPPELGRRLSEVGEAVVAAAVERARPEVPFAVIAMGKLGGSELSFGSDLDLMFVHEGEGSADFEAARRAAERTLVDIVAAGWQPDPDLRPEGRAGPLVRSMASFLEYWERWAEPWEYQALLRARPVAGEPVLGRRFVSNAADFAFPEVLTRERLIAVRRMRVRIEEERVRPPDARRFHLKLGYGSLADVQWAVELSLMRHGATHPEVRRTNTLEAIEALAGAGLLEASVAASLAEASIFLTRVKNAIEVERRLPAESLPPTPEAQTALARSLGFEEPARHRFLQEYRRVTRRSRSAMERVFYGDG